MLQLHQKKVPVKSTAQYRYLAKVSIYNNEYTIVEVFDKLENREVLRLVNRKQLVSNRQDVTNKFGVFNVTFKETILDESLSIEKVRIEKEIINTPVNISQFSLFVKQVTSLLKEYNYQFKPDFKKVDGNLNVNLLDGECLIINRIEKRGDYYYHFFNEILQKKVKDLEVIFK